MIIRKAYDIERKVASLNNHTINMIVWHVLRKYLNWRLPKYYRRKAKSEAESCKKYTEKEVIVSLTTYPQRMDKLPLVLETLFGQSVRPSRIILWLAESQYPNQNDVKRFLESFISRGLEVRFFEDLRAHKKYFFAMQENPDALVITVDDDIFYSEDMIKDLLTKHKMFPKCIVSCRAHEMIFEGQKPIPYSSWNMLARGCTGPDLKLFATGGAGCLYPPGSLSNHVFDKDTFMEICLYADDIWMKCMSFIVGTPVVLTEKNNPEIITVINPIDDGGLAAKNVVGRQNDVQLSNVTDYYQIDWSVV